MIYWSYDIMYDWYTKENKVQNDDIIAILYDTMKPSNKSKNIVEPFIKRNIKHVGLSRLEGIYIIYGDNKSAKQWLYLVKPRVVTCQDDASESFLAANHFSFCYDKSLS